MRAAFMRTDAVGMVSVERKQVTAILQDDSGLRFDDTGTEAHEVALNEGDEIAVTVRRRDILRVRAA